MTARRCVAVLLLLGLAACTAPGAGAAGGPATAGSTPSSVRGLAGDAQKSDPVPTVTVTLPTRPPVLAPGPAPADASVSVYAGVDRAQVVHLGGRVATAAQRSTVVAAAAGRGRVVEAAGLAVVPRATTADVDRAVEALGRYLAVATGGAGRTSGDGSLKIWLLDRNALAQATPVRVGGRLLAAYEAPAADLLRAGGVTLEPSPTMGVTDTGLAFYIFEAVEDTSTTFPFGTARLTTRTRDHLRTFAEVANHADFGDFRGLRFFVTGHARTTEPDGQDLSLRRARAVADFLVAHGVAADRVAFLGYDDHQDGADNPYRHGDAFAGRWEIYVAG